MLDVIGQHLPLFFFTTTGIYDDGFLRFVKHYIGVFSKGVELECFY
jgi:hypothetical protein